MARTSWSASASKVPPEAGSSDLSDPDETNDDTTLVSEKVLGKKRARTPPEASSRAQPEDESLSDADAEWEPDYEVETERPSLMVQASAPKFARLASEPDDSPTESVAPQPGPSTRRGPRPFFPVRRQGPRTRASSSLEESSLELDALPYGTNRYICGWRPLGSPNDPPCTESCTRFSDLRRHQRPHFEIDLEYAKDHLNQEAVAKAQAAVDKCSERGKSFACEVCGKVYSRSDAVARHRQQPQGRQCNKIYKQRRAEEKREREKQEAEEKHESEQDDESDEEQAEETVEETKSEE